MAEQGRKIDDETKRRLERLKNGGMSIREAAREALVSKSTAQKYLCPKKSQNAY